MEFFFMALVAMLFANGPVVVYCAPQLALCRGRLFLSCIPKHIGPRLGNIQAQPFTFLNLSDSAAEDERRLIAAWANARQDYRATGRAKRRLVGHRRGRRGEV